MEKPKHIVLCLHCLLNTSTYEVKKLCLRNLVNLELANCNWDSLFLILGFREFPQVDRFMLLGFSLLDPPSWVSNSSWPSGMGEHILSVKDFKMCLWVSHLKLAFLFFISNENFRERTGHRSWVDSMLVHLLQRQYHLHCLKLSLFIL